MKKCKRFKLSVIFNKKYLLKNKCSLNTWMYNLYKLFGNGELLQYQLLEATCSFVIKLCMCCVLLRIIPGSITHHKNKQLYSCLPPISQTILVRQAQLRTKSCDILLWTPTHGHTNDGWSAKTLHSSVQCNLMGVH